MTFTGQIYKPTEAGTYQVIANVDGCIDGYSNSVEVGDITGLEDETSNSPTLYPNPAEKQLTLKIQAPSKMKIIDVAGREQINQIVNEGELTLDVSSFAAGLYVVIIENDRSTHRMKFIKR